MPHVASHIKVLFTGAVVAIAAVLAAASCGGGKGAPAELLTNAGFEDGKSGWTALTTDAVWEPRFDIADGVANSGARSAYLKMRTDAATPKTHIFGVTQEVTPDAFPSEISGYYRVDNWQRATVKQYMQVVVVVFNAENKPDPAFPNHQIRYILAGIGTPPFAIGNAKYMFLRPADPPQGQWVPFKLNVADDFQRLWGAVPEQFEKVRLLFEVRFDDKAPDERPSADVYFDDLHVGKPTDLRVP